MKEKMTIQQFQKIVKQVKNLDVRKCFDSALMQKTYLEFVKLELVNQLLVDYGISFEKYQDYIEWRNGIIRCFESKLKSKK